MIDLLKSMFVLQLHLLRDVLRPATVFLGQIKKRGLCLDRFASNVNAANGIILILLVFEQH